MLILEFSPQPSPDSVKLPTTLEAVSTDAPPSTPGIEGDRNSGERDLDQLNKLPPLPAAAGNKGSQPLPSGTDIGRGTGEHKPLRLRGGAAERSLLRGPPTSSRGSEGPGNGVEARPICPFCSEPITTKPHEHLREHVGQMITLEAALRLRFQVCECGFVTAATYFARHAKSCHLGRRALAAVTIQSSSQLPAKTPSRPKNTTTLHGPPQSQSQPAAQPNAVPSPSSLDILGTLRKLALLPTTYKKLAPGLVKPFIATAVSMANEYLNDPSEDTLMNVFYLPKIGLAPGLKSRSAPARLAAFFDVLWLDPTLTARVHRASADIAVRLVSVGRLSAAMSAVEGDTHIARPTEAVVEALRLKQPPASTGAFANIFVPPPPLLTGPDIYENTDALASFRKDTAPGISGWTVNLLTMTMKEKAIGNMLVDIAARLLQGSCPAEVAMCASRLTPLDKPDGGIRPIAVGDLFLPVCQEAILRKNFRADFLVPYQLGVGSKGGTEPIIHYIRKDNEIPHGKTHIIQIDLINAFNTISRRSGECRKQWTTGETL